MEQKSEELIKKVVSEIIRNEHNLEVDNYVDFNYVDEFMYNDMVMEIEEYIKFVIKRLKYENITKL